MTLAALRAAREITSACRRMDALGLIGGSEANASARLAHGTILITPSGVPKTALRPSDLLVVDYQGSVEHGSHRPSSELPMHLPVYATRDDVKGILHAHSSSLGVATLTDLSLDWSSLSEAHTLLDPTVSVPFFTPGSKNLTAAVGRAARNNNVLILERHRAVAVGYTVPDALCRLEILERCARELEFLQNRFHPEDQPIMAVSPNLVRL